MTVRKPNFSEEFKRDAVAQITERGYPVAEVSERLGVSQHSLYAWKRQLAKVSGLCATREGTPACAGIRSSARQLAPFRRGVRLLNAFLASHS